MGDRLKEVDAHDALFLLKNCFAIPKLMYVLRTAPTFKHPEILLEYDNKLKEVLQSILNVTLEDDAWLQSSLPVTSGGLGIRLASDLALPTFLSSAYGAEKGMATLLPDIIKEEQYDLRQEAEITWKETVTNNNGEPTTAVPSTRSIQSSWDKPMFELKHSQLLNSQTNIADKARLLAVSSEHSSDWLNALPVPALGLKLDNPSIRMACGLRLGTPLCHPHTCQCGAQVDQFGRHGLSCKSAEGRHSRHSQVNDLIKRALGSAQTPAIREPPGLCRHDQKRPDGLTLLTWSQGRSLVWDYTCSDTLAPSHLPSTSQEAGKSALQAEKRKLSRYEGLATSGYIVLPVANATLGSWAPMGLKFIKEVGSRIAETTGEKRSTSYLFQAIGIATQRGNSASIAGTVPSMKRLDELYYL